MRSRFLLFWVVAFIAAAALIFAPTAHVAQASTSGMVISAVYAGGGNGGSTYRQDFVELFNGGASAVTMTNWSVQWTSGGGSFPGSNGITTISGTVQPGKYFLIQLAAGTGGTTNLPTPDATGLSAMGASSGKVALVNTTTAITGSADGAVIDFVGYGSANDSEGGTPTAAPSATNGVFRKLNGCQDTGVNGDDFEVVVAYPNARNSASAANSCTPEADMALVIAESQDPVAVNTPVTYTLTATNEGTAAATNVTLTILMSGSALPNAISNLSISHPTSCVYDSISHSMLCGVIASIAVDESFVVSFDVTPTTTGTITVNATVAADAPETAGNNSAQESTDVLIAAADLTVTTSWTPSTVYSHSGLTVTFTINNGPLSQADGVTLQAVFDGTAFSTLLGTPTAGCSINGGDTLDCNLGTIAAGGSTSAAVSVDLSGYGTIEVNASVATTSTENDSANNFDSDIITVLPGCGMDADNIYDYQEGGANAASRNVPVVFEGIVTADFQEKRLSSTDGYFIQQVPGDGDPLTSDGVFVFDDTFNVSESDSVRVYGTITEYNGLTQVASVTDVINCGTAYTVTPTTVALPLADLSDWENYEGMLVTVTDLSDNALTVADQFNLDNFGEMIVSTQKLYQPTHLYAPGSTDETTATDLNNRSKIIIDDGSGAGSPNPVPHYEGNPSVHIRMGDSIAPITGVVAYSFNTYRVHYTEPLVFTPVSTRPTDAPAVGGRLKVGSFNVLNYFNGDGLGGGFPTARGAGTLDEFNLQTTKLVAAILKLDADILGLMEIENDSGANQAAASLVNALNAASAPGTYAFIDTGMIGTDAIKVAILYQPANVTPAGSYATDTDAVNDRPTLAQTFTENISGETLTVVVNHFKSKGSCPGSGANIDQGDGQGCWALKRVEQAQRLLAWLDTDPTGQADTDFLILGDLNSYAQENTITTLKGGGYTNLIEDRLGVNAHSYYYSGQAGYLDHALASASMEPQVTGIGIWNINANEPDLRDYNDFANALPYKELNEFRTSDHDPVLIGVSLNIPLPPAAFELLDPENGAMLRSGTTTFTWTESIGATSYNVYLSHLSDNTRAGQTYMVTKSSGDVCAAGICSLASSELIAMGLPQGSYSWTVVTHGLNGIEASDGPNLFTVSLVDGIELVVDGGFENGATTWTFANGGKYRCGAFGDNSDCALNLKLQATAVQTGQMAPILANVDTTAGDVLKVSAAVLTQQADRQRIVMVVVNYANPAAGVKGNGKDKFKLFVEEVTTGYETFSANFLLADSIVNGKVVVRSTQPSGKVRVDDVSVILMPIGTVPRAGAPASPDGLLPLPAAPDNFRGNN